MIAFMIDLLRTPDAQRDPYAWSSTLLAHAFIGVALAAVLPWGVPILAYAAWEAVQWRRYEANAADCVLDWCAVSLGVCLTAALSAGHSAVGSVLALAIVLFVGVRARR
jgi:hypothetical protein